MKCDATVQFVHDITDKLGERFKVVERCSTTSQGQVLEYPTGKNPFTKTNPRFTQCTRLVRRRRFPALFLRFPGKWSILASYTQYRLHTTLNHMSDATLATNPISSPSPVSPSRKRSRDGESDDELLGDIVPPSQRPSAPVPVAPTPSLSDDEKDVDSDEESDDLCWTERGTHLTSVKCLLNTPIAADVTELNLVADSDADVEMLIERKQSIPPAITTLSLSFFVPNAATHKSQITTDQIRRLLPASVLHLHLQRFNVVSPTPLQALPLPLSGKKERVKPLFGGHLRSLCVYEGYISNDILWSGYLARMNKLKRLTFDMEPVSPLVDAKNAPLDLDMLLPPSLVKLDMMTRSNQAICSLPIYVEKLTLVTARSEYHTSRPQDLTRHNNSQPSRGFFIAPMEGAKEANLAQVLQLDYLKLAVLVGCPEMVTMMCVARTEGFLSPACAIAS